MRKMFSYLLTLGLVCGTYSHTSKDAVCSKLLTKTFEESECIVTSECTILHKLIQDGEVVDCGIDGDTNATKVCCPKGSRRVRRQTNASAPKKDPYAIAQQKCSEYSAARYVEKTLPAELPGKLHKVKRLECAPFTPLLGDEVTAKVKEFPHMALIGYSSKSDKSINKTEWLCGGSLISDRYVLTAANCMKSGNNYEATWVRLGELVLDKDDDSAQPRDFRIAERIPHPKSENSSPYFNIMLLKLQETVTFTPHMRPVCLYTSSVLAATLHNQSVITGWGPPAAGELPSEALLKAKIKVVNDSECVSLYKGDKQFAAGYDPATMVCAEDVCFGISGSPLQVPIPEWACMFSQVGISSYGAAICGQKNVPSIFTKVSSFIPWIQPIVWP